MKWEAKTEKLIKRMMEKSTGYAIMHRQSAEVFATYHKKLGTVIFIGLLLVITSSIAGIIMHKYIVLILVLCLVVIDLLCFSKLYFSDYRHRSFSHDLSSARFSRLKNDSHYILNENPDTRGNLSVFFKHLGRSFHDLFQSSPKIPQAIFLKYVEEARTKGISIPEEYGFQLTVRDQLSETKELLNRQIRVYRQHRLQSLPGDKNEIKVKIYEEDESPERSCEENDNQERSLSLERRHSLSNKESIHSLSDDPEVIDSPEIPNIEITQYTKSPAPNKTGSGLFRLRNSYSLHYSDGRLQYEIDRLNNQNEKILNFN